VQRADPILEPPLTGQTSADLTPVTRASDEIQCRARWDRGVSGRKSPRAPRARRWNRLRALGPVSPGHTRGRRDGL